jgi:hypothetical protein
VQPVHVLRDDVLDVAPLLEGGERIVRCVWACPGQAAKPRHAAGPVPPARRVIPDKSLVGHRLVERPPR